MDLPIQNLTSNKYEQLHSADNMQITYNILLKEVL